MPGHAISGQRHVGVGRADAAGEGGLKDRRGGRQGNAKLLSSGLMNAEQGVYKNDDAKECRRDSVEHASSVERHGSL